MKKLRLLLLPIGGIILFTIGLLLQGKLPALHYALLIAAVGLTLVFYFITLNNVIHKFPSDSQRRIFWLVAIICLPVIGNVIYVIFQETVNRKQQPHGVW